MPLPGRLRRVRPGRERPLTFDRWIIDPAAGKVSQQRLDDRPQEFPRVSDHVVGRPHRYGYSAVIGEVNRAVVTPGGDFADQAFSNALLKHDLAHGSTEAHEFGRDATAGEAVFAASGFGAEEDEGYVMAFVHNPDRGAADLVPFSRPRTSPASPSRASTCPPDPLGFHGSWIPDR